jgi:transmembrane sensor
MPPSCPIDDSISQEAARWLARHDRGLHPQEQREFDAWLAGDPRQSVAYERVCAAWDACERAKDVPELARMAQELDEQTRARPLRRAWSWHPAFGLAAAAAVAVFVGVWQWRAPAPLSPETGAVTAAYHVIPNTVRRLVLEDGSIAELRGSDSTIQANFTTGERRVLLLSGEVHFEVAKNPNRPFVVAAGRIAIRAVGTAFNVQLNAADLAVMVTEGQVSVTSAPAREADAAEQQSEPLAPLLAAGQRASFARETPTHMPVLLKVDTLTASELAEVLAWQATWLIFDGTPLADTIEAFNRHGSHHLVIEDAALRTRRLTGKFRTGNIEGFLRLLERTLDVRVERRAEREIALMSGP